MSQVGLHVAIVGATGEVGRQIIKVLERSQIPISSLRLLASKKSAGKKFLFRGTPRIVEQLNENAFKGTHLAFFSAGGTISLKYVQAALKEGAVVIDNTSAFRMNQDVSLVVPEVNAHTITATTKLIANPNCSTIQLVVALKPLLETYGLESVNVATYQAISGAGTKALLEYDRELKDTAYRPRILPAATDQKFYQIAHNIIPQVDVFTESGYTKEELKMINETQKILNDLTLKVNATCVRVPVRYGHSLAITVKLKTEIKSREEILELFGRNSDTILHDHIKEQIYPMPVYLAHHDGVYVGRIRKDLFCDRTVHLWVVTDNILKGAALNSVQIADYMHSKGLLGD